MSRGRKVGRKGVLCEEVEVKGIVSIEFWRWEYVTCVRRVM